MTEFPIVLSAPSGGGKTTIAKALLARRPDTGYSVSCTTRSPRPGEVDGRDYYFWSDDQFESARAAGEFAEWANVHGRKYGTLRREVERVLSEGRHVVMDIDVQGAVQIARTFPLAVLIFVLPPSAEVLLDRLAGRGSEDPAALNLRIRNARAELLEVVKYDYVVVNDVLDAAVSAVESIIEGEVHRRSRHPGLDSRVAGLIAGLEQRLRQSPSQSNQ